MIITVSLLVYSKVVVGAVFGSEVLSSPDVVGRGTSSVKNDITYDKTTMVPPTTTDKNDITPPTTSDESVVGGAVVVLS